MRNDQQTVACRKASGWAIDRAYGELSPRRARDLDQHLDGCSACAALAAQARALSRVEPAAARVDALMPRSALLAARTFELRLLVRAVVSWGGRAALAFMLALACAQGVRQGPILGNLSSAMSWLVLFAWTVVLAGLLDRLLGREVTAGPAPLSGRAVAYGVLASVGLSLAMVGTFFFGFNGARHFHGAGVLPDIMTLLSATALLLVGLAMGAKLGRESSPNMLAVLALYGSIMVPALLRGAPALLPTQDILHLLCLAGIWGLSGAYLGSLMNRARDVETPRAASL